MAAACCVAFGLAAVLARGQDDRTSLAGEEAAQKLKRSVLADDYRLRAGPVRFRTGASVGVGYTDNVFYSQQNVKDDVLIIPELTLGAYLPVSEMNTLRLSVGIGYEWYLNNSELNSDAPLINPDTELEFNVFVGDFRLRFHDRFSYQESLFFNSQVGQPGQFFNFNDVGRFKRLDNFIGVAADGDFNRLQVRGTYDHEDFRSMTDRFDYLDRASEWFGAQAAVLLGDQFKVGPEGQFSLHNYFHETELNDHWRGRVGPFIEATWQEGITLRAGGGYDTARYDDQAVDSDYETYYAYARASQETRTFHHSLSAGREHYLGNNANNLRLIYVRYDIGTPIVKNLDLGASGSVNIADEFGGAYHEEFNYFRAAAQATYRLHKYWQTDLSYEFLAKDSRLPLRDYDRHRVFWSVTFTF